MFSVRWHRLAARMESAPYHYDAARRRISLDDGRGGDLCFHTPPLGSRMLGLRPMSKIDSACAVRAHFPTASGTRSHRHAPIARLRRYFTPPRSISQWGLKNFRFSADYLLDGDRVLHVLADVGDYVRYAHDASLERGREHLAVEAGRSELSALPALRGPPARRRGGMLFH